MAAPGDHRKYNFGSEAVLLPGSERSAGKDGGGCGGGGGQRGALRGPALRGPARRAAQARAAATHPPRRWSGAHSERRRAGRSRVAVPAAGAAAAPHGAAVRRTALPRLARRRGCRLLGLGQQLGANP